MESAGFEIMTDWGSDASKTNTGLTEYSALRTAAKPFRTLCGHKKAPRLQGLVSHLIFGCRGRIRTCDLQVLSSMFVFESSGIPTGALKQVDFGHQADTNKPHSRMAF